MVPNIRTFSPPLFHFQLFHLRKQYQESNLRYGSLRTALLTPLIQAKVRSYMNFLLGRCLTGVTLKDGSRSGAANPEGGPPLFLEF